MPRQPNVAGSNGGPCASSSAARSAAPSLRRAITAIRSTTSSFVAPPTVSGSRARSWGKAAALEQEQLECDHRGGGRSDGRGHGAHRRLAHGLGDELARDEPEHPPAAKPRPTGRNGANVSTSRKAGTAIKGCGRLEKTLHAAARATDVPEGTRTRLIASPSGTLCTVMATAIRMPSACSPPKATPTPTDRSAGSPQTRKDSGWAGAHPLPYAACC